MNHRRRLTQIGSSGAMILAAATLVVVACSEDVTSKSPGMVAFTGPKSHWVGCEAGVKYTGGGRIDPVDVGKVTFGFNVHAGDCSGNDIKGQLQVVYHYNQTLYHTVSIDHFASFHDPQKGDCGEFDGTVRSKHVDDGGDWHYHHFSAEVCDNGEPGHGVDRFTFLPDGAPPQHQNVWAEPLTGGNIQAHKH